MGHAFFLEDGAETGSVLRANLGLLTRRSNALLATDTTPATFWITHPNNTLVGNVAAGAHVRTTPAAGARGVHCVVHAAELLVSGCAISLHTQWACCNILAHLLPADPDTIAPYRAAAPPPCLRSARLSGVRILVPPAAPA